MKKILLLTFLQCMLLIANAESDRYPNIQSPTTTSAIIAWTSASSYIGTVKWGTSATTLTNTLVDAASTKRHALTITGLQPNTKYYYKVTGGSFASSVEYFTTAKPDSLKTFDFVVFGDCGFNSSEQDQIATKLGAIPSDFGLIMGDVDQIVGADYDGNYFSHYKSILAKQCYFTTIGNHDILTNNTNYTDAFYLPHNNPTNTELYYSFTWGNAKYIALDGNIDYNQGSAQYNWLESELKCNNSEWVFVYFHQPPWTNGWSVIYYIPLQPFFLYQGEEDMRTSLVPLFEKYKVDFVLNGHAHDYQSGVYHGVHYIITGGGGTPANDNIHTNSNSPNIQFEYHGDNYMKFSIDGDKLHYNAYDINGVILDSLSLRKNYTPYQPTFTVNDPKCPGMTNGKAVINTVGPTPPYTYNWSTGSSNNTAFPLAAGSYTVTITDGYTCPRTSTVTLHDPLPVNGTATVTNSTCFGSNNGTISITPTGGTAPYNYIWNTGDNTSSINHLPVGLYNVVIRDSFACADTVTATVTQPTKLTDTISATNTLCAGDSSGAVTLSVSGATAPYSYIWNTGAVTKDLANVASGIFKVTITDANGCRKIDSALITSSRLQLQASINNETCPSAANGSIAVIATGGTAPYNYVWANAADPTTLTAGSYEVSATDANNCSTSQTYPITTIGGHDRPVLRGDILVCLGDSTQLTATTGFGTYAWNNGSSTNSTYASLAGNYYLTATDTVGCTVYSDTLHITNDSIPHLQLTATTNVLNAHVEASRTGVGNYQWDLGNGHTVIDTAASIDYTYPDAGTYTITLVTQYRCGNDTATIAVHVADTLTGILYLTEGTLQVKLQPNPMHSNAQLSLMHGAKETFNVALYTEDGRMLRDYGTTAATSITIQRGDLAAGIYLIRITNAQVKTTLKMVVE